jgi:tetratricopeptide (TPR) repeat protein
MAHSMPTVLRPTAFLVLAATVLAAHPSPPLTPQVAVSNAGPCAPQTGLGQTARPHPPAAGGKPGSLAAYVNLVDQHTAGTMDEAVRLLGRWQEPEVEGAAARLRELDSAFARAGANNDRPELARLSAQVGVDLSGCGSNLSPILERAVIAHTDFVFGVWASVPPYTAAVQLEVATKLVNHLVIRRRQSDFGLGWHLAVGGYLTAVTLWNAGYQIKRGLDLFPDSAPLHLAAGVVDEAFGTPAVQRDIERAKGTARELSWRQLENFDVTRPETHRVRARSAFRRALAIDPSLTEARVRLGHVLLEEGSLDQALTELERARSDSIDPVIRYYSLLFAGRVHEKAGRLADARASYEAAAREVPSAQTPAVALSGLLDAAGMREAAVRSLEPALPAVEGNATSRRDPWWDYPNGSASRTSEQMRHLWRLAGLVAQESR